MPAVNVYVNFSDNTEEAFNFYKSVFGGEFLALVRYKDGPESDKVSADQREKILHVSLPIGKGSRLMGTDASGCAGYSMTTGNNMSICLDTESEAETKRLFEALSEGGTVLMPLEKTFWNAYFGMVKDRFGLQWMLNYEYSS